MNSLTSLTDAELSQQLKQLESRQRETMAQIIEHLVEVERRRLHLRAGYSSLYEYCCRELGLSEDEAYRRMTAARLAAKFPEVQEKLAQGKLTLTTVGMLKPHLSCANAPELLELAAGQSKRSLEKKLAARFPEAPRPDVLERGRVRPTDAERYRMEVALGESTKALLDRALDLMAHTNCSRKLEPVLERALALLVDELEREKRGRLARANERDGSTPALVQAAAVERNESVGRTEPAAPSESSALARKSPSRSIPRAIRRRVFERDGARCTFTTEDGRRCECTRHLELDHREPWSLTGEHSVAGLRVLCRAHNRLLAEDWFGRERVLEVASRRGTPPAPLQAKRGGSAEA